jgi:hypothetical protein
MFDPWPSPPFSAEPTIVAADTPCRKCQYNLRSLSLAGRCPECGTPVGLSIKGDLLCYSEPLWLHSLRRGTNCTVGGIVIDIVALIFVLVGDPVQSRVADILAAILCWVGAWLLTTSDPSGLGEDNYGTSRKVIRITLLVSILIEMTQLADETIAIPSGLNIAVQMIEGIALIVGVVGPVAMLNYLRKLALRLPSHPIADRAKFLMYALPISYCVVEVPSLLVKMVGAMNAGGFSCFILLGAIAYFVFYLMYLRMLMRLGNIFKSAETFARLTWAAATSPI